MPRVTPIVIVMLLATLGRAQVQDPPATMVLLLTADLEPKTVQLQVLRDGVLSFFDASRAYRTLPLAEVLRLRFPRADKPAEHELPLQWLHLTDGQRLAGAWTSGGNANDLAWRLPDGRVISLTLEQVRGWQLRGPAMLAAPDAGDEVRLVNGDVLHGFVMQWSDQSLQFQVNGATQPLTLPADRLQQVVLANPSVAAAGKHMVRLADGVQLLADQIGVAERQFTLNAPLIGDGRTMTLPLHEVVQVDLATPGIQLVDLADLPFDVTGGGTLFDVPFPPRRDRDTLHLHAPVTLRFRLPAGARRVAGQARLDLGADVPVGNRNLADCVLTLNLDGGQKWQHRLNAGEPEARFNVPADGTTLELRLDDGVMGPVLDRVLLAETVLLVHKP